MMRQSAHEIHSQIGSKCPKQPSLSPIWPPQTQMPHARTTGQTGCTVSKARLWLADWI